MVRSGELPSRLVSLKYGADLVWGPETVDRALVGASRRINPRNGTVEFTRLPSNGGRVDKSRNESVIYRIDPVHEKGKLVFQLGTASAEYAVPAARLVAGDVAGIDVNSGCPKPFSTSGGMGAALLREPERLCSILEALIREVGNPFRIGVSVKIRILETPERTGELVSRLVRTGITGLTVHCRTPAMRPRQHAIRDQIRMIVSICREAGVACVMNGDVANRDQALALMREFDVDGAMIASAAEQNFSCFRSEADGGLAHWRDLVHDYLSACMYSENKLANTKYLLNMLIPGKCTEFKDAKSAKTYADCCHILKFDDLLPAAFRADEILDLADRSVFFPRPKQEDDDGVDVGNKAAQKARENNDSARAAGGAGAAVARSGKASPPVVNANGAGPGPIRTNSIPSPTPRSNSESEEGDELNLSVKNPHLPSQGTKVTA